MIYELRFKEEALKEWKKTGDTVRKQFKRKLKERLEEPRVPASKLGGSTERYKIKLRSSGYRLVYEVRDEELVVVVVAVGKRDHSAVHRRASKR